MIDELSPKVPPHLTKRIRAELLRVESKKRDGAELNACLRDAYEVLARVLKEDGTPLTEDFLTEIIPAWVLRWAVRNRWYQVPWLLRELGEAKEDKLYFAFGDLLAPRQAKADLLKLLGGRIAHWQAEELTESTSVHRVVEKQGGGTSKDAGSKKPNGPKRGPYPNEHSWRIAKIVDEAGPSWKQSGELEDVCEKIDQESIPTPLAWKKWPGRPSRWKKAVKQKPDLVVKVIEQRLKMARTYSPPSSSEPS